MTAPKSVLPLREQPRPLHPVALFHVCASDRDNFDAWSEFLQRYAGKVKYFIRGTLRQVLGSWADWNNSTIAGSIQESDLFQNTILRLVEKNCAAMKRFSGETENELMAYLAVISRSTVMDALRRSSAIKRRPVVDDCERQAAKPSLSSCKAADDSRVEHIILANELISLIQQAIKSQSGHTSIRDQLVFELHFLEGLSFSQISRCEGISLSKAGVEKVLRRLIGKVQDSLQTIDSRQCRHVK